MLKINCYYTSPDRLHKAFISLTEKCFFNQLKLTVITPTPEFTQAFDEMLWTYSRKNFIPHATDKDPLPHKQPIYICNKFENLNKAEVALFINPDEIQIKETLHDSQKLKGFSRIMYLLEEHISPTPQKINKLSQDLLGQSYTLTSFKQISNGGWQEIS